MVLVALAAATAAGFAGTLLGPHFFATTPVQGFSIWFVTELVNYVAILPVVLTLPQRLTPVFDRTSLASLTAKAAPAIVLCLSCAATLVFGGPGSEAFPVPALLWCAVAYGVFPTALLTLLFSAWTLAVISGHYNLTFIHPRELLSIRLAVTLMALAPIAIAVSNAARNSLLRRLEWTATHDALTGTLNRAAFHDTASDLTRACLGRRETVGVLMLDIDHFKAINDNYGHAAGDTVIASFAGAIRDSVRAADVVARLGGEEFGVMLPGCARHDVEAIAERIRDTFAASALPLPDGARVTATVSIGVSIADDASLSLSDLLRRADTALYAAKNGGRNRVVLATAA
jgi:diguanylate cyclase (GGDEF)-like protein